MSSNGFFVRSFHKNLQRLASLALCTSMAQAARPLTVGQLADRYKDALAKRVPVMQGQVDSMVAYISERALVRKYAPPGQKTTTAERIRERLLAGELTVELQDLLLADESLPSSTGGEKDMSYGRTVSVCQEVDFLKDPNATPQTMGIMVTGVASDRRLIPFAEKPERNPFLPDGPTAIAAYLSILRSDYSFQRHLIQSISNSTFSFIDMAKSSYALLTSVLEEIPNTIVYKDDRDWLRRQLDSSHRLNARNDQGLPSGTSVQTLFRPLEDLLLTRLEFLVDVQALRKPDRMRYTYTTTPSFNLLRELVNEDVSTLDDRYFQVMSRLFEKTPVPLLDTEEILEHLRPSFTKTKVVTGLAPITETIIRANCSNWRDDSTEWQFVEISQGRAALESLAKESPARARITPDRFRRPHSFRLVE